MIDLSLLSLLIPWLLGLAILSLLTDSPAQRRSSTPALIRLPLALGLGIGLCSCTYFLSLLLRLPACVYLLLEAALGIGLLIWAYRRSTRLAAVFAPPVTSGSGPDSPWSIHSGIGRLNLCLAMATGLMLLLWLATFVTIIQRTPHGAWDAWAIWNLRARFLFYLDPEQLSQAFQPALARSHPDYPLLLPGFIARSWQLAGDVPTIVPIMTAAFFTFGTAALLAGILRQMGNCTVAMLGVLLFLGAGQYVQLGAIQYADVPLTFFILAAIGCLLMAAWTADPTRLSPESTLRPKFWHPGWLVLTGLCAGLAAWTKNEGSLFLVLFLAISALGVLSFQGWLQTWHVAMWLIIGLGLPLLCLVLFKMLLAPPGDLTSVALTDAWQRLGDGDRYSLTLRRVLDELMTMGGWRSHLGWPVLGICFLLLGVRKPSHPMAWGIALLTLLGLLLGYILVYLITPNDLDWHLETSVRRITAHLLPSLLLLLALLWPDHTRRLVQLTPGQPVNP